MTVPERMGRLTMGNAEDGNERDIRHERKDDGGLTCNELRLSVREWIVGGIVVVAALGLLPILWERTEEFRPGEDYRIPYELSNDYWLFDRYSRRAGSEGKVLVIGDSVIWGHYVKKEDTLSGQLNRLAGGGKFANMGVDGIHPAALAGLLEYYGKGISNGRVILHCNLHRAYQGTQSRQVNRVCESAVYVGALALSYDLEYIFISVGLFER